MNNFIYKPWDEYTPEEQKQIELKDEETLLCIKQSLEDWAKQCNVTVEDLYEGNSCIFIPMRTKKPHLIYLMNERNKSFLYKMKKFLRLV